MLTLFSLDCSQSAIDSEITVPLFYISHSFIHCHKFKDSWAFPTLSVPFPYMSGPPILCHLPAHPHWIFMCMKGQGKLKFIQEKTNYFLHDMHEVSSMLFMLTAHVTVCGGGQDHLSTYTCLIGESLCTLTLHVAPSNQNLSANFWQSNQSSLCLSWFFSKFTVPRGELLHAWQSRMKPFVVPEEAACNLIIYFQWCHSVAKLMLAPGLERKMNTWNRVTSLVLLYQYWSFFFFFTSLSNSPTLWLVVGVSLSGRVLTPRLRIRNWAIQLDSMDLWWDSPNFSFPLQHLIWFELGHVQPATETDFNYWRLLKVI